MSLDPSLLGELCDRAHAGRWGISSEQFSISLVRSIRKALPEEASPAQTEQYLRGLHLEDLSLACACELGRDDAWEHFIREFRPALYRAAGALDATGGARELADALYGELFGVTEREGVRQSLFRYFHGRSSLGTWLRSVLSQRYVDRVRAGRRTEPLADNAAERLKDGARLPSPDRRRQMAALLSILRAVIAALSDRDRLRLACYYAQNLTLAQIGRLTGEHEATVSRHLTRTRRLVRQDVERRLRDEQRMTDGEIAECFAQAVDDSGAFDLDRMLAQVARKDDADDRSR